MMNFAFWVNERWNQAPPDLATTTSRSLILLSECRFQFAISNVKCDELIGFSGYYELRFQLRISLWAWNCKSGREPPTIANLQGR